ncbi:MAG: hypothetical protein J5795_04295 [Lachnospiraceae bacterium]|nr:hypothetical protein [Lachnospiraceae bacterium]
MEEKENRLSSTEPAPKSERSVIGSIGRIARGNITRSKRMSPAGFDLIIIRCKGLPGRTRRRFSNLFPTD